MKTNLGSIFREIQPARQDKRRTTFRAMQPSKGLTPSYLKKDTFSLSPRAEQREAYCSQSEELRSQIAAFSKTLQQAKANDCLKFVKYDGKDYESMAKNAFEVLDWAREGRDRAFPKRLEEAGVPEDIEFEFDFDIDSHEAVITKISDESFRGSVNELINHPITGNSLLFDAYASCIMNRNIASVYYQKVGRILDSGYGQDIKDLYVDSSGRLCGANKKLQEDIDTQKAGNIVKDEIYYSKWHFPSDNIEALLKRLISEENITPNVSHMGYTKNGLYTDDGDFKISGKTDESLFANERYALRGMSSIYFLNNFDHWLNNEDKF